MEFVKLTEKEYLKFWEKHPLKTFLSSIEIGKLRSNNNWDVEYVGVKENKKVIGATMLVSRIKRFGKKEYYSPRGYLIDFSNKELVDFFTINLKKYIKENKGYVLRIDPYVINKERDIDGNIVEDGIDNTEVVSNLKKLGFKQVSIPDMEQVGWMFSLDLENKTEEQILKEMKPNTRNTIRKAEKIGITIRELEYEELDKFQDIMVETGERKNFSIRKLSYYQDMYKLLHDKKQIKYVITELDLKKYIKKLEEEIETRKNELSKLNDAKYNDGKKKALNNEIDSFNKRIKDTKEIIKKTNKNVITLSGSMFIMIEPEIIYLSSGNYEEYLHFNSQYLIQWDMIKYGIKNGYKKHNFYGIPANINEKPKDYGIYEFKRGFNGYVEELIGEFELPISKEYYLFKLIHKIRK
ncbi:MAG: peptidoglycan bridge formation glycyltransferase FemA/FemB family protein [Bacilli bacterium]|nr:peptidoglycan bridge formation glycyltransferase FemA/FemB family protein [Bacilli bacterium]